MSDISSPTPIDGQTWPSFPDNWYSDATPDRPMTIVPPPAVEPPPVYTPPPQTSPPYSGTTYHRLIVVPYDLGHLGWQLTGPFTQIFVAVARAGASGVITGKSNVVAAKASASGIGVATGRN